MKSFSSWLTGSIRREIIVLLGSGLVIVLGLSGFFLMKTIDLSYSQISDKYLSETMDHYREQTAGILAHEYSTCEALTAAISNYESIPANSRRNFINKLLKDVLENNDTFVDTWTCWEPEALDGLDGSYQNAEYHDATGRFIPYWTKSDGKIACTALTEYDGSSWYEDPLKSTKGILINPNVYEIDGKKMLVAGVAFPVLNSEGKAVGVVGLDMAMDTLTDIINKVTLFKSGYLSLVSASGLVAVDKNQDLEGKTLAAYESPDTSSLFTQGAEDLKPFIIKNKIGKTAYLQYYAPFKVRTADQTWFIGMNIPELEVSASSVAIIMDTFICFAVAIVVTLMLTLIIISAVTSKIKAGADAMKNIAQGDGDLTVRMTVKRRNELGDLYTFFNQTIAKIQKSVKSVKEETAIMKESGTKLADDMNDTAAAANEIKANIDSVNQQVTLQSSSVKKATDSIEMVNSDVQKLMNNIESQSSSVVESSSAVEQMVANIRSVTKILEKNSGAIKSLEHASEEGTKGIAKSV